MKTERVLTLHHAHLDNTPTLVTGPMCSSTVGKSSFSGPQSFKRQHVLHRLTENGLQSPEWKHHASSDVTNPSASISKIHPLKKIPIGRVHFPHGVLLLQSLPPQSDGQESRRVARQIGGTRVGGGKGADVRGPVGVRSSVPLTHQEDAESQERRGAWLPADQTKVLGHRKEGAMWWRVLSQLCHYYSEHGSTSNMP